MLKDARAGAVERVVDYKLDRLGRSLAHFLHLANELGRLKSRSSVLAKGLIPVPTNASGRLFMQVLGAVAEFERELIRERVVSGINRAKAMRMPSWMMRATIQGCASSGQIITR